MIITIDEQTSIQEAINNASVGDIIHIPEGTWTESVILRSGIDLDFALGATLKYEGADNLPTIGDMECL